MLLRLSDSLPFPLSSLECHQAYKGFTLPLQPRGEKAQICRVPWWPLCPAVDRVVHLSLHWQLLSYDYFYFGGSEALAPIPVVHGCTFMCVPQFYPHVIHSDSKPLKVDPLLSQHFHIPSGAHGNLCRQWGARTYILGSGILTYPAVFPVKLLQGHTGSNFS